MSEAKPRRAESIRIRATATEKRLWARAAVRDGRTLSSWIRRLAAQAAAEEKEEARTSEDVRA